MFENAMDDSTLKQYLADDPPTVVPLAIRPHFEALNNKEKKYAHYLSRASLAGTRINLRQVSPESEAIYDFILELHKACNGMLVLLVSSRLSTSNSRTLFGSCHFHGRVASLAQL